MLVEGPPGAGRSRCSSRRAARPASGRGGVRRARAGELEQAFAFGVVGQLFERRAGRGPGGAPRRAAALGRARRRRRPARARAAAPARRRRRPLGGQPRAERSARWTVTTRRPSTSLPVLVVPAGCARASSRGTEAARRPARARGRPDTLRPAPLSQDAVARVIAAHAERRTGRRGRRGRGARHGRQPVPVTGLARELAAAGPVEPEAVESLGARAVARPVLLGLAPAPARLPCARARGGGARRARRAGPRRRAVRRGGRRREPPRRSSRPASSTRPPARVRADRRARLRAGGHDRGRALRTARRGRGAVARRRPARRPRSRRTCSRPSRPPTPRSCARLRAAAARGRAPRRSRARAATTCRARCASRPPRRSWPPC